MPILTRHVNRSLIFSIGFFILLCSVFSFEIIAKEPVPEAFKKSGIDEKLGQSIPLDLVVQTDQGQKTLNQLFVDDQPVMLVLSYYSCPMLCNLLVTAVKDSVLKFGKYPGQQYQIVSFSFDPLDTSNNAQLFKDKNLQGVPNQLYDNWHFITASQESITRLTQAVGFRYFFDSSIEEFSHIPAIIMITPKGVIARYLYGLQYEPTDLRLAITEAKLEKTRSTVEKILLFCYNYNPDRNSYTLFAVNLMKIAGILTVLSIMTLILYLKKKEIRM